MDLTKIATGFQTTDTQEDIHFGDKIHGQAGESWYGAHEIDEVFVVTVETIKLLYSTYWDYLVKISDELFEIHTTVRTKLKEK